MKRYINIIVLFCAVFFLAACNAVVLNEAETGQGYLTVCLDRDDEVFSKALVAPDQDMAFKIEVYQGNELIEQVADHRTLTQSSPLTLRIGKYRVVATYGDNTAGFDKPYYVGETEVTIKTDVVTEAQLVCALANVMVTVEFDQSIIDNFSTYSVFIEDGSGTGAGLGYSNALANLSEVGYIPATGTLKWNLNLVNKAGSSYLASDVYTGVKPQQHYNLKFALADPAGDSGYAAIKLIVDNTLVEQEFDLELDFSESELPTFTPNDGFVMTNEMSVIVGDTSKKELTFTSPEGIKSFILAIDNQILTRISTALVWYELVGASSQTISELASYGIKAQSIAYGATTAVIDITDYISNLPTGNFNVDITLYDTKGHVADCPMDFAVISDVDADMVSVTPWAKFVLAKGKYFSATAPEGTTFMYKKSTASSWSSVPQSSIVTDAATKTFEAEIGGLDAESTYLIKAVSAADTETREVEFTTGSALELYNLSFDDWYQSGDIWYPYAQGASPTVWDSANPGAATFIGSSTTPESSNVKSGKAARLESKYAMIAFAAGNIYTGKFGEISGVGAILDWGTPFTSRPVALRGYYDYTPAVIDNAQDPYMDKMGETDRCQIQIFITDWDQPFTISTDAGQFVDLDGDPAIIAHGKMESEVKTNGYSEFVIPLEYRDNDVTRIPKYIVISGCASYLGDYFTGGVGSLLYMDDFSLEYDITTLTDEQKAKVNYR